MKFIGLILLCVVSSLLIGISTSHGQDLFGGHGIRSNTNNSVEVQETEKPLSKMLDFSTDMRPDLSRFQLFRSRPGSEGTKMNWFRRPELGADGLLGNMPTLFPKRDPNAPGFIEQLNSKSRDFVDRTSDWAQRQNENLRSKTFDRWDAITKDLKIPQPRFTQTDDQSSHGMQPPVRSADSLRNQPKVRF